MSAAAFFAAVLPLGWGYFAAQSPESRGQERFHPSEAIQRLLSRSDAHPPRLNGTFPCVSASPGGASPGPETAPKLGKCELPLERSGPVDRFEADLRYGSFVLRQSDLYLRDTIDVPLTRTYDSGDYLSSNRPHAFGRNASLAYDWDLVKGTRGYTQLLAVLEDGDFLYFYRVSKGSGYADAVFQHTETSTPFYKSVISWTGNGWTLYRSDGSSIVFPAISGAKAAVSGPPDAIRDAQGNVIKLVRDSGHNLTEIRTPNNRSIHLQYDELLRISLSTDDQGNRVQYFYDTQGMLSDVRWSTGPRRHYAYEKDRLVAVTDENYRILVQNNYLNGWLVSQKFPNGQEFAYYYDFPQTQENFTYAESATVLLPDGTTTHINLSDSVPDHRRHPF